MSIFRAFKNTQVHALTVFELTCHFISVSLTLPTCLCKLLHSKKCLWVFFFFFNLFLRPSHCSVGYRSCSREEKWIVCQLTRIPCKNFSPHPIPKALSRVAVMTIGTLEMRKGQLNENLVLNLLNWERKCKVLGEKVPSVCRSLGFGVFLFIYLFYFLYLHSVFNYFWLCFEACGVLVPQPGIKPVLPALEAGVLITGPPRKPHGFSS